MKKQVDAITITIIIAIILAAQCIPTITHAESMHTWTATPTNTPLPDPTSIPTETPLPTQELTVTIPYPTEMPTFTPLPTHTVTHTPWPTQMPTFTPWPTLPYLTPEPQPSLIPTNTPTDTPTPAPTPTKPGKYNTPIPTPTSTPTWMLPPTGEEPYTDTELDMWWTAVMTIVIGVALATVIMISVVICYKILDCSYKG